MSVGKNIQRIRESRGVTQSQLAEAVGVTQSMICQIERETKNPSLQVGKLIADILGVSVEELMK